MKRLFLALAALIACLGPAAAQDWPSKPIKFVVPFATGGATDALTRLLCEQLGAELKVPCVVENKAGAGGNVGGATVAASAADGYTFLVSAPGVLAYNKILYREMSFDPDKELDPICLYAFQPNVLVVNPSLPVNSVAELIAYAKANPRKLNYASGGVGSTSHVAGELFRTMAGLE
jgi:tripartite-type tricarboxylate transporter receptor subunit TctC